MRRIRISIVLLSAFLLISGCSLSQMPEEQVLLPLETTFISYEDAASMIQNQQDDTLLKTFVETLEVGCPSPQPYMSKEELMLTAPEMLNYKTAAELNSAQLVQFLYLFINMQHTQGQNSYEVLAERWFQTWEESDTTTSGCFVIPIDDVRAILDHHLSGYVLNTDDIPSYHAETDSIYLPTISGLGGNRWLRIAEKSADDESQTIYLTIERCSENYEEVIDTRDYTVCLADSSCIYTSIVTRESN